MDNSRDIIRFEDYRDAANHLKHGRQRRPIAADQDDAAVLGQYIPLIYHYNLLQDEDRVTAFQTAINLVVQPGMRVLELGGGTGILSSFAARRGAHVTCVERNPELVDCARRFVSLNKLEHLIDVATADASDYVPVRPVDVVICEMLHVGLLREKQAQVITCFKQNYTAAFGKSLPVFIPETSILMAQPVQQSFDFHGFQAPLPMFHAPTLNQPRTLELASLSAYANINYELAIPTDFQVRQSHVAEYAGTYNAVRFVTQNVLAIDLAHSTAITWPNQCLVVPVAKPGRCFPGDQLDVQFAYQAGGTVESLLPTFRKPQTRAA